MKKILKKIVNKINSFKPNLSSGGERVDIKYKTNNNFDTFDIYQKSHYRRYEYALKNINKDDSAADLACGTGYGAAMLSTKAKNVLGIDISLKVIESLKKRYKNFPNLSFLTSNLLELSYENKFNTIVSFETVEHLEETDIPKLFSIFYRALRPGGKFIFSVPFMQETSEKAVKTGFHKTFYIDEKKIKTWLDQAGFKLFSFKYQNYITHKIMDNLDKKDFIICIANK